MTSPHNAQVKKKERKEGEGEINHHNAKNIIKSRMTVWSINFSCKNRVKIK